MEAGTAQAQVRSAGIDDLPALAALFDGYRVFYGPPSDPLRAGAFLRERLERGDSHLLLAVDGQGGALGFAQLYPAFTSVGTAPIEILNDLFVEARARGHGVGRALLRRAAMGSLTGMSEQTREIFCRLVVDRESPTHVAEALNVRADVVYTAKSRVLKRLKEECGDLIDLGDL